MIDLLIPYINEGHRRAIPEYSQFLDSQRLIVDDRYRRIYESLGYETRGMMVIKFILQFIDWDYFHSCINNYTRYTNQLRYVRKDLIHTFDRTTRGRGYRELFFAGRETEEFLLPIEDINATVNLPLHTEDWNEWKYIKPLRIVDHNSDELSYNLLNSRATYKNPPSYAIELLDVVGLIFKYAMWNKHVRPTINDPLVKEVPMQYFIHKHVICDVIYDLVDIFLLRQFNRLIRSSTDELNSFSAAALTTDSQYGRVSQHCARAYDSLHKLVHYAGKNTPPETLLNSRILLSGSINQRMKYIDTYLPLPITRPYEYVTWMRDHQLFFSTIAIMQRQSQLPRVKTMMVNIDRDYQRMLNRRVWNSCNDVALKAHIEKTMVNQASYLKSDVSSQVDLPL